MSPDTKKKLFNYWMDMSTEERNEEMVNPDNSFQEFKKHYPAVARDLEVESKELAK